MHSHVLLPGWATLALNRDRLPDPGFIEIALP